MTRSDLIFKAQRLRAQGLIYKEIGEQLGVPRQTAWLLVNDPDGSRERARKRRYDLECVCCGGRVDGTTPGRMRDRDNPVCHKCAPVYYSTWTRESIICAIQEWADEHGGIPPSANQWQAARAKGDERVCSVNEVQGHFGSWNAAIIAAGFEPHAIGPVGGYKRLTPEQRQDCARRYAAGESSVSIAADFDCSPPVVLKWARQGGAVIRPMFGREAA